MGQCMYRTTHNDPIVTLNHVGVGSIGLKGGTLNVVLSVANPNGSALDGRSVSYSITKVSDGTVVGEGTKDEPFAVPSHGSADVRVPVQFTWGSAGAVGKSVMNRGSTTLKISAEVTVHSQILGDVTIPFCQVTKVVVM